MAEKDDLTLLIRQLHPKVGEFEVFELFSTAGKVLDVRLIMDERTGKCQGVGYVEMADTVGLQAGLMLNGKEMMGTQIVVQTSLAEKNRLHKAGASTYDIKQAGFSSMPGMVVPQGMRLYVGGLDYKIQEANLKEIFASFGELEKVDLHKEADGTSKGYAFLHFKNAEDGRRCMDAMDGFELAGRSIRVSISEQAQAQAAVAGYNLSAINPMSMGAGGMAAQSALSKAQDSQMVSALDSLDENLSGAGKVTAAQRSAIMARLAVNAGIELPEETRKAAQNAGGGLATSAPDLSNSRCVILKNMFDRLSDDAQSNPNYFLELADDVRGECAKLGTVLHCAADKWSNGFVYVKMLAQPEALRLKERMNGRFFAQNKIVATLIEESVYDKKMKLR